MPDSAIFYEWIAFGVRWLHVITAIAWIGSSFYFIALDLGLKPNPKLHKGVRGEEWQVHGGGFYHIQKYMVAPEHMPEHLIWFKWEAYTTWLSGFALLAIVYYVGADLYLIDRNVMDMGIPLAIFLSVASIAGGWIIYDLLCKSPIGKSETGLMVLLFGVLVFMAWGYTQIFTGRAALLHLGAFTATIMSANVFFIIIPNQKVIVADLKAGKEPDPALGKQSKQRSVHNNYLTLPVIFLMLSNHYPLAFATQYNWVIASMIFLIGVLIRHFFNTKHETGKSLSWTWFVSAVLFILIMWLSTNPKISGLTEDKMATLNAAPFMASAQFEEARDTVMGRCSMCHTEEPVWDGVHQAPKNVILDNDQAIAAYAKEIYIQAGRSHAMPPSNVTYMSDEERELLVAWYESVNQ